MKVEQNEGRAIFGTSWITVLIEQIPQMAANERLKKKKTQHDELQKNTNSPGMRFLSAIL
jgi:hypothetical protein